MEWHNGADFPVGGTTFPKLYLDAQGALTEIIRYKAKILYTFWEDAKIYDKFGYMNRHIVRDITPEDGRSLTFTQKTLLKDLGITGVLVMDLRVTSSHPNGISHFLGDFRRNQTPAQYFLRWVRISVALGFSSSDATIQQVYTGGDCHSSLTPPVFKTTATVFQGEGARLHNQSPEYQEMVRMAWDANSIAYVTVHSAPLCSVYSIYDCGIQAPLERSIRMFQVYS